jgi:putative phosphoribosyl transferase
MTIPVLEREISIPDGRGTFAAGTLVAPEGTRGLVLFAHGSGSSLHSPRNRYVASFLQSRGLSTLLMDLLTVDEEEAERWTRHLRFDIGAPGRALEVSAEPDRER